MYTISRGNILIEIDIQIFTLVCTPNDLAYSISHYQIPLNNKYNGGSNKKLYMFCFCFSMKIIHNRVDDRINITNEHLFIVPIRYRIGTFIIL